MKKIIAISVMLALVAGAAFAQTSVSGVIETRMTLINGSNADGAPPATIGGSVADGYAQLSGQDADGTFGGLVRVRANSNEFHRAFAWWRPIPQLRIFLGHDLDGLFGTDPLTAWGFHQGGEGYLNRHDWDFWRAVFPGNWDGFGAAFSIYPVPGAELNIVVPTGLPEWFPGSTANANQTVALEDLIGYLRIQGSYNIPDIGRVYLSYIGPRAELDDYYGQIGGSFLLTAVPGVQVQLGVTAFLVNSDLNHDHPLLVGLAAHYAGGDYGVKFRAAAQIGGYAGNGFTTSDSWRFRPWITGWNPFTKGNAITFNVMPWYNLDFGRVFFDIGMDLVLPDVGDSYNLFWVNPYFKKSIGPGQINAGLMIVNNGATEVLTYNLPVRFVFSF